MTPDEIDGVKRMLWDLSEKKTISRDRILEIVKIVRRLLNAYQGSIKKQYRLRDRLRKDNNETNGH